MIGGLLTFWTTYKIKLILGAVALMGILYVGRLWLNSHDNKVAQETRAQVTKELDRDFQEKYKIRQKEIDAERAAIIVNRKRLDADRIQFNRDHNAKLKAIQDARTTDACNIAAIPPSERRAAIRAILAELGTSDAR